MIDLTVEECCGCSACMSVCPTNAIGMISDYTGSIVPEVNIQKCINCSLCNKVCPEINDIKFNFPRKVYAVGPKLPKNYKNSASGGAATMISQEFINSGGIVYGCCLSSLAEIGHIRVDSVEDLELLQGSKYVHSDTLKVFKSIKSDLSDGLKVLFIGTPCQVGAVKSYLLKEYENLYTMDLICHGVPPQDLLRNSVKESFKKSRTIELKDQIVKFRWKYLLDSSKYGIKNGIKFGIKNKGYIKEQPVPYSPYMGAFLPGLSFREHCHQCKYACPERVSDITVGDFWGLGIEKPSKLNAQYGVSVVLENTVKGKSLFKDIESHCICEERTLEEARKINHNLNSPTPRPANKNEFWEIYNKYGVKKAVKKCNAEYRQANKPSTIIKTNIRHLLTSIPIIHSVGKKINNQLRKRHL